MGQSLITKCLQDDADSHPSAMEITEVIKQMMETYSKKNTRDGIGPILWLARGKIKCEQEATKTPQVSYYRFFMLLQSSNHLIFHNSNYQKTVNCLSEPVKMKWREGACSLVECSGRVAVLFNGAVYLGS